MSVKKEKNSNLFYYFGTTVGSGGGGYIKKHIADRITEIKCISERIVVAKIKLEKSVKLSITQVCPNLKLGKQ